MSEAVQDNIMITYRNLDLGHIEFGALCASPDHGQTRNLRSPSTDLI